MVGTGSGSVWFDLQNGFTGGATIPLYDPATAAKQLTAMGKPVDDFLGLANSFLLNCRGRHSSHGFFLVRRGDIDRLLTDLTAGNQQGISLTIRMEGSATRGGSAGHEDVTKEYQGLSVAHAYAISGVVAPSSPSVPTSADLKHSAQKGSAEASWQNQLYVLHVVDTRHWVNQGRWGVTSTGSFSQQVHGTVYHNTRKPYWTDGTAEAHYYRSTYADTYSNVISDLLDSSGIGFVGTSYGTLGTGKEDLPTEVDNFNFKSENQWDAVWEVLDEISHTMIYPGVIAAKGYVDTTTETERTTNKPWLISVSNDLAPSHIPSTVNVSYALIDNQWQVYDQHSATACHTSADVRVHNHTYTIPIDVTTFTSGELGSASALVSADLNGGTHTIEGRLFALHDAGVARTYPSAHKSTVSSSVEHPSNKTTLEADAKKRAILYIRGLIRDDKLFNETYQGFIDFTPTISLSSILWANTGDGAITRIRNLGMSNDDDAAKSVPFLPGRASSQPKPKLSITARPSNLYEKHRQLQVKLYEQANAGDGVDSYPLFGTAGTSATTITWGSTGSIQFKVYNTSDVPIPKDSIVTVYFDDQVGRWIIIDQPMTALAKVVSTIAGSGTGTPIDTPIAVGETPELGEVEIYYLDDSTPPKIQTTGETVYATNIAMTEIVAGSLVTIKRSLLQENWVIDMEICQ